MCRFSAQISKKLHYTFLSIHALVFYLFIFLKCYSRKIEAGMYKCNFINIKGGLEKKHFRITPYNSMINLINLTFCHRSCVDILLISVYSIISLFIYHAITRNSNVEILIRQFDHHFMSRRFYQPTPIRYFMVF